jgi:hypothetical protein
LGLLRRLYAGLRLRINETKSNTGHVREVVAGRGITNKAARVGIVAPVFEAAAALARVLSGEVKPSF